MKNMRVYNKKLQSIFTFAPFVQILFCLAILKTTNNFFDESMIFYLAFFTCVVAFLLVLIPFFWIARKAIKIGLLIYMPFTITMFIWYNGLFENISIKNFKNIFKDKSYIEIAVDVGNHPFDYTKFYIELEQFISANQGVDSVFLIGLDELNVSVLGFSVNEDFCDAMGISIAEPVWFIDSIMTLSPPAYRYEEFDTLKFKGIPIEAFLSVYIKLVDYKPNLIKPKREDEKLGKNEVKYLVYSQPQNQDFIMEKLKDQFDSLKQFLPYDVKISMSR